ncbi:MAG: SdrD B-like domain-containing protein [Bacteroidota bacterium]
MLHYFTCHDSAGLRYRHFFVLSLLLLPLYQLLNSHPVLIASDSFHNNRIYSIGFDIEAEELPLSVPVFVGFASSISGGNVSSLAINVPSGNTNDLLIAAIATDSNTDFTTPPNWILVDASEGEGQTTDNAATLAVYYRVADSSEPSSYTFNWSGSQEAIGAISRYSGVDVVAPIHAFGVGTGKSSSPTCPSISTTINDALIIRIFGADGDGGNNASAPTGTNEVYIDRSSSIGGNAASLGIAYEAQNIAGTIGTAAFSNNNEEWRAISIAIAPPSGPSCAPENVTAYTSHATCSGMTANSDGQITLSTATQADRYALAIGNGFIASGGDPNYSNAIAFDENTDLPLVIRNDLPNPAGSQDYTLRIFNGETDCFKDIVLKLNRTDCNANDLFESDCNQNTDFTVIGTAGFEDSAPENEQCITLADWGIDPANVNQDFNVNLFFDGGLNSVTFTTENGQSVAGIIGSFFAEATLQADGSSFICASIDATNDARAEDMSFFALIPETTNDPQFGYAGRSEAIDDEIFNQPCGVSAPTGSIPINLSGNPNDLYNIKIDVPVSEVELGDPRTITFNFTACNSSFSQSINPEPLIGRPGGFNILTATLMDVPGNCTQIDYEFCSNSGEQSYGVAFVLLKYECGLGSIGSTVFMDNDNDGQFEVNDGEMGIGGVTINLNQISSVQDGGYLDVDGDMTGNDSDDDGFFVGFAVIDGRIDLSGDGQVQADGSDDGMIGDLVIDDGLVTNVSDGGRIAALLSTTTTATAAVGDVKVGDYFFGSLAEGNYQVEIPTSNFASSSDRLFEKTVSSVPTDTNDNGEDNDDNGIQAKGKEKVVSPLLTITNNGEPENESGQGGNQDSTDDNNGDMTIDFGFINPVGIGGTVFDDRGVGGGKFNDGAQNGAEAGISDVKVVLLDDVDNRIDSMMTDAVGNYLFKDLAPGDYKVLIVSSNFDMMNPLSTTPFSSVPTTTVDDDFDNDDNGIQVFMASDVCSPVIRLSLDGEPSGSQEVLSPQQDGPEDSVQDRNTNTTIDFGFQDLFVPVELLSFQAKAKKEQIEIEWTTASETNNSHFELERSENAKDFKPIARMKGSGTSIEQQQYNYTDQDVQANVVYYYRLKQVDFDDSFEHSRVVSAKLDAEQIVSLRVFPNPTQGKLSYQLTTPQQVARIQLFDLFGQLQQVITNAQGELDMSHLPAGIYILVVENDAGRLWERILKE